MRWYERALGGCVAVAVGLALSPAGTAFAKPRPHPGPGPAATSATLTASSASIAQDSWVTLQAQVTSNGGTPAGSVTFTDASNGSILGTATLVSGAATLTTAALAPGTRQLVASFNGGTSYASSSSAPLPISVAQAGSDAVTYQIDAAHDGSQAFGAPSASTLTEQWHVTL